MQGVWGYDRLPEEIKQAVERANLHFGKTWCDYTEMRREKIYYCWDENYILPIRVKTVFPFRGGILDTEPFALTEAPAPEKETAFLNGCCRMVRRAHITWVECDPGASFQVYPERAVVLRRGNYILDLQRSDEELLQAAHSKQRNMIRRGAKEDVVIRRDGDQLLADYKALEDQVWRRNDMPLRPMVYYQRLSQMGEACSVAVAYKNGKPQAGGIFLVSRAMAYYHHGASCDHPVPGTHAYLMWEQFRYLRDQGVEKLNFVGYRPGLAPDNKGYQIQHFKERFGGELIHTYYFRYISNRPLFFLYRLARMVVQHESFHDFFDEQSREFPDLNPGRSKT